MTEDSWKLDEVFLGEQQCTGCLFWSIGFLEIHVKVSAATSIRENHPQLTPLSSKRKNFPAITEWVRINDSSWGDYECVLRSNSRGTCGTVYSIAFPLGLIPLGFTNDVKQQFMRNQRNNLWQFTIPEEIFIKRD